MIKLNDVEIDETSANEQLKAQGYKLIRERPGGMPEVGQAYYFISGCTVCHSTWGCTETNRELWELGLVFLFYDEAEHYLRRQKAVMRVRRNLANRNTEVFAWEDGLQKKYLIGYSHATKKIRYSEVVSFRNSDELGYSTKEGCEWVIDNMQEDLKLIFGEGEKGGNNNGRV